MSNAIEIYHGSPSELVVIDVTIDGVPATTGVKVCIYPVGGTQPRASDPGWQDPDTAGADSGILVGTGSKAFAAGDVAQPWYKVTSTPEVIIERSTPLVRFT